MPLNDYFTYSGPGPDALYDQKTLRISFFSFSTQKSFWFNAFLTQYNESYKSEWNSQTVYGRMDPISTFKNTTRKITLGIDIPSYNLNESIVNTLTIDTLIQSLYPIYKNEASGSSIMSTPPLFRIKFSNLIAQKGFSDDAVKNSGLLCYLDGFDYAPDSESGFFTKDGDVFPKLLKATFNLNIIHEKPLGNYIAEDGKIYDRSATKSEGKLVNTYNHIDTKKYDELLKDQLDPKEENTEDEEAPKTDSDKPQDQPVS